MSMIESQTVITFDGENGDWEKTQSRLNMKML